MMDTPKRLTLFVCMCMLARLVSRNACSVVSRYLDRHIFWVQAGGRPESERTPRRVAHPPHGLAAGFRCTRLRTRRIQLQFHLVATRSTRWLLLMAAAAAAVTSSRN
jgi:hypothetical protein